MRTNKTTLETLTIAVPESRQLNVLAELFERRGANVIRCPLVSIHDNPDSQAIIQWLRSFIENPPDILLILTGEGIRRLTGFATKAGLLSEWQQALASCHKLARGPKPDRALKELELQADQRAAEPTTEGMITTLESIDLSKKRVAVQLYGQNPNQRLQQYLQSRQANYNTVAPYIYASDTETSQVEQLITKLANHNIDMICFTSKAQYERMAKVAKTANMSDQLHQGLTVTRIAAVGPVVADQLREAGYTIAVMPGSKFFMKPMVRSIEELFSQK